MIYFEHYFQNEIDPPYMEIVALLTHSRAHSLVRV